MKRRNDWPERLYAYLDLKRTIPFEWGANDCAHFAADAIVQMTDEDVLDALRGKWTNAREALEEIERLGGLEAAATRLLGDTKAPSFAQRGDLVLFESAGRSLFGIAVGPHIAAPGESGLVLMPFDSAKCAWTV